VKYLLDTNTCIGWLRLSQPNVVMRIKQHSPADMTICAIVVSELLDGVERALPAHRANNRRKVDQLRQQFVSLPFDVSLTVSNIVITVR
jgi:tRNA(fMet)-specific endonuclease VapC